MAINLADFGWMTSSLVPDPGVHARAGSGALCLSFDLAAAFLFLAASSSADFHSASYSACSIGR